MMRLPPALHTCFFSRVTWWSSSRPPMDRDSWSISRNEHPTLRCTCSSTGRSASARTDMLPLFFAIVVSLGSHSHDVVTSEQPFDAAALTWSGAANVRILVGGRWITPAIDADITERHATAITHFPVTTSLEYEFDA